MIRYCLLNTNENDTVSKSKKFFASKHAVSVALYSIRTDQSFVYKKEIWWRKYNYSEETIYLKLLASNREYLFLCYFHRLEEDDC